MRSWTPIITLVLVLGACGGRPAAPPSPTSASPVETLSPSLEPSPSPEPSPSRELEQGEMPRTFAPDLGPAELPPEELVPKGADVTGQWFGFVDDGAIVLVAWAEPGSDFSRLARGFALWIPHDSSPHWRVGLRRAARRRRRDTGHPDVDDRRYGRRFGRRPGLRGYRRLRSMRPVARDRSGSAEADVPTRCSATGGSTRDRRSRPGSC